MGRWTSSSPPARSRCTTTISCTARPTTGRASAARASRSATCRRPRFMVARCSSRARPTPASRSTSPTGRCGWCADAIAPATPSSCSSRARASRERHLMSGGTHIASGKVRELYALGEDRLLLVASDRISTFDVILPTEIPDKGRVLTGLSAFWFARTRDICPNHLLALRADGRAMECRRLSMLPIECVVRGYLAGSGWKDYRATGAVCGHALPAGLREADRLPAPIFTPATKAAEGHDENITRERAAELVGEDLFR